MRARLLLPLAALLALAACATTPRDPLVYLLFAGSGPCTVDVNEKRYVVPDQAEPLMRAMSRLAKGAEGAVVDSGAEPLSYACYRQAMTLVRKAGFARLGLVTAAPPDPSKAEPAEPADPPRGERPGN